MEFIKQDDQNQIQKNFSKRLKKGIFKVGICLSLLLGLTAKSFAGLKEAENYALNGLTELSKDPTSGLSTCSPRTLQFLIFSFVYFTELRLGNPNDPNLNLILEQFTYGNDYVFGIKEILNYPQNHCADKDEATAELQQLFSRMVFAFLLSDGNAESSHTSSPVDGGQENSPSADSVFQPSVTRVDSVFQPTVMRVDRVAQNVPARVDSVVQPTPVRVDSVFQPAAKRVDGVVQPTSERVDSVFQPTPTRVDSVFQPTEEAK